MRATKRTSNKPRHIGVDQQQHGLATTTGIDPVRGGVVIRSKEWEAIRAKLQKIQGELSSLQSEFSKLDQSDRDIEMIDSYDTPAPNSVTASSSELPSSASRGIFATNKLDRSNPTYLGSKSMFSYVINKIKLLEGGPSMLDGGILTKLGLDNESSTYPFENLWSSNENPIDIKIICNALPSNEQCREFFHLYRDVGGAIYPVLPDITLFEKKLETLLQNRESSSNRQQGVSGSDQLFSVDLSFLALLFAVLASGCQSSDLSKDERELMAQVFVCCSYQCLRMTNFMSKPTIGAIQTLLIIANTLAYNLNAGASCVLLAMPIRMSLALGLHVETGKFPDEETYHRRYTWWSLAWQDTWFSLSFDRPSTIPISQPVIPYQLNSRPGGRTYFETKCRIISLTIEIVRERMFGGYLQVKISTIVDYMERIQQILRDSQPYLRFPDCCRTLTQRLQRAFLTMQASYISAELSRSTLHSNVSPAQHHLLVLQQECVANLIQTVKSYIEIHSIDARASRAWIAFQRCVSCAFLLAVTKCSRSDPVVKPLLQKLEVILTEHATEDVFSDQPEPAGFKSATALNGTLSALRKLITIRTQYFTSQGSHGTGNNQGRIGTTLLDKSPSAEPSLGSSPATLSDDLSASVSQHIQPSLWAWNVGDYETAF